MRQTNRAIAICRHPHVSTNARRGMKNWSMRAVPVTAGSSPPRYVLDASMVSQTWSSRSNEVARDWLAMAPVGSLFVPGIVLEVIEQGIARERQSEPEHAEELTQWKHSLQEKGFTFLLPYGEVLDIADAMMSTRSLKNLWLTSGSAKREKIPHAIFVAATSIAFRMKITTLSTKGYQSIVDAGFRLPGFIIPETRSCSSKRASPATTAGRPSAIALH